MNAPAEKSLEILEFCIEQTAEAYFALKALNVDCRSEVHPQRAAALNRHSHFWNTVAHALRRAVFVGIYSSVDGKPNSANFFQVLGSLSLEQRSRLPSDMEDALRRINKRYGRWRHNLFAHQTRDFEGEFEELGQAGFSWEGIEADLVTLTWALKNLRRVRCDQPTVDRSDPSFSVSDLKIAATRKSADDFVSSLAGVVAGPFDNISFLR